MHRFKKFTVAVLAIVASATPGIIKADVTSSPSTASIAAKTASPTLHMRITAYSSTPDQTDDTPFTTASGLPVGDGIVASNILPFGTRIRIPELFGDKIFTVEDRMAVRFKNSVDIWMPTREKAIWFGVHEANIVLVTAADSASAILSRATRMITPAPTLAPIDQLTINQI